MNYKSALVLADLEGVTGLVSLEDRQKYVKLATREMEVVTSALLAEEISRVMVCDVHDCGDTIYRPEMEKKGIGFVSQFWNLDFRLHYDLASLTGFHGMSGSQGYFPHTFRPDISALYLSPAPAPVGEIAFFISWLALQNIPVALVVGDEAAAHESQAFDPRIPVCAVKGIGKIEDNDRVYLRLANCVKQALARELPPPLSRVCRPELSFFNEDVCPLLSETWLKKNNRIVFPGLEGFAAAMEELCHDLNRVNSIILQRSMDFVHQIQPLLQKWPQEAFACTPVGYILEKHPAHLSLADQQRVWDYLQKSEG